MPSDPKSRERDTLVASTPALPVHFRFQAGTVAGAVSSSPAGTLLAPAGTVSPFGAAKTATAAPFPAPGAAPVSPAAAGAPAPGTRAPFAPAPTTEPSVEVSGPRFSRSSDGRGLVRLAKLSIALAIFLTASFFFMRNVFPVMLELAKPGSQQSEAAEKSAGVQMIRQTRDVVAQSDVNVARINAIIDGTELPEDAPKRTPQLAPPALPEPVAKPAAPEVKINLKAANRWVDDLPVNGVIGGANPKIVVNGLLINVDDVVDWRLGLVFAGVDESARVILFRHKDGTLLRRRY